MTFDSGHISFFCECVLLVRAFDKEPSLLRFVYFPSLSSRWHYVTLSLISFFFGQTKHVQFIFGFNVCEAGNRSVCAFVADSNCISTQHLLSDDPTKRRQVLHHHDLFRLLFGSSQLRVPFPILAAPISVEKSSFLCSMFDEVSTAQVTADCCYSQSD